MISLFNSASLLQNVSTDGGVALNTPGTPQNQAVQWLESTSSASSLSPARLAQRYSLATFYYSTNGANWADSTNWLTEENECTWTAVTCEGDVVSILKFTENNLGGSLPREIGLLSPALTSLALPGPGDGSGLTGQIPTEVGTLTFLTNLNLAKNNLSGPIPGEIGQLGQVLQFNLGENQLSNNIPPEVGFLTSLKGFYVQSNQLSGIIPPGISNLVTIKAGLDFSNNNLSGVIPSLGKMPEIKMFKANGNNLQGQIPADTGTLTKIQEFAVEENNLTGSVPEGMCSLAGAVITVDCGEVTCSCCGC